MGTVTPEMKVRLVMCAAGGDTPVAGVLRWLPGAEPWQIQDIADMWEYGQPGKAWDMARALVGGVT